MCSRRALNICGVSRISYWHGIHGGMDVHGRLLSEALVRRGHRVTLICTAHPDGRQTDHRNGVDIIYLAQIPFGSRRPGWPGASAAAFESLDRRRRFDMIWSQSYDAFGLTDIQPVRPMLTTVHGCIAQELATFGANLSRLIRSPAALMRSLAGLGYSYFKTQMPVLKAAAGILAVSPRVQKDLLRWYGRAIAAKCRLIPNGVDTAHFKPDSAQRQAARRRYGIDDGDLVLLTLGRITVEKGHHLAVEVVRHLRSYHSRLTLMVVGSGPGLERLQRQVSASGLQDRVMFTGHVSHERTAECYRCADIFLMPTLTVEGLPFVLLEAMACGLPVVAARIGGNPDLIEHEKNGLLVAPGNRNQLSAALERLIASASLRRRLAIAARKTIEQDYGTDHTAERVENEMLSLCAP